MRLSKFVTAAAIVVVGVGIGASSSQAVSITGGPNVDATWSGNQVFTIGGYNMVCADGSFAGSVSGQATMTVTPQFAACDVAGIGVDFATPDPIALTVSSNLGSSLFSYNVTLPTGSAMVVSIPGIDCEVTVAGPQTLSHGVGGNSLVANALSSPNAVLLGASVSGISYTTNGSCPFGDGDDGAFEAASARIDGIGISN